MLSFADKIVGQAETKKASAEEALARLQHANRLAVHVWEEDTGYAPAFPEKTWEALNCKHDEIKTSMHGEDPLLLSMSLMPKPGHNITMRPFRVFENSQKIYCSYLVDVSQGGDHAPFIPRIHESSIVSNGEFGHDKRFNAHRESEVKGLRTHQYGKHGKSTRELLDQSLADHANGGALTEEQLDALGKHTVRGNLFGLHRVNGYNELLVGATKDCVRAIMIPYYSNPKSTNEEGYNPAAPDKAMLFGALAGLQHLEAGIDLPVVSYSIHTPKPNDITYIGQGKEELTAIAIRAIKNLQTGHADDITQNLEGPLAQNVKITNELRETIKNTQALGFDILEPIEPQLSQVQKLLLDEPSSIIKQ